MSCLEPESHPVMARGLSCAKSQWLYHTRSTLIRQSPRSALNSYLTNYGQNAYLWTF
jgi:hypothetical protein